MEFTNSQHIDTFRCFCSLLRGRLRKRRQRDKVEGHGVLRRNGDHDRKVVAAEKANGGGGGGRGGGAEDAGLSL